MKWPNWLNPAKWFKRDITIETIIAAGLCPPRVAGVLVTPETALGVSAVFCADRVISEDLATLPMLVYSGSRFDDGATPEPNDPITALLAQPNPEMTGPVFWSAFQHNANVWGFGLAEIVRDGAGRAVELWPIPSPSARIARATPGRLTFAGPGPTASPVPIDPANVLFLPGFTPDGSVGFQLLNVARQTIGMAVACQQFGANRFANGMTPSGVIKHNGLLSDQARENMRASWKALYAGTSAAAVPMILEAGTGWESLDLQHNDQLQLAELLELLVDEVARFFNISPVKLHKLGRATWSNLETLNRDHVITTLGPWIAKRDAEVNAKLLSPGRHCRHIVDRLLAADTSVRFAAWSSALTAGWMTPNEVRRREDLPPIAGGDELYRPLNQGPATDQADEPAQPPAEVTANGQPGNNPPTATE